MKLNFVCIGAQKAGTTTLHDILITHPEVYLPPDKEAHFFNVEEYYEKGIDYYFDTFFSTYKNEKHIGNINPNLQLDFKYLNRIKECFGTDVKIIFILRNPVNRAYSHYLMSKRRGFESLDFLNALEAEPQRLNSTKVHPGYKTKEPGHFEKNHFSYVYRGKYSKIIRFIFEEFGSENVKIILFEDLIGNTRSAIKEILYFLDIPNSSLLDYEKQSNEAFEAKNATLRDFMKRPSYFKNIVKVVFGQNLKNKTKTYLNQKNSKSMSSKKKQLDVDSYHLVFNRYFANEIVELETILGKSLDIWKPKKG